MMFMLIEEGILVFFKTAVMLWVKQCRLEGNNVGNDGACFLAEALDKNSTLEHLK